MGYRTVEPEPYVPVTYLAKSLATKGEKVVGIFIDHQSGQFGEDYRFALADGGIGVFTAKDSVLRQVEKCKLLQGDKTTIILGKLIDTGKQNPMKQWTFNVEDATDKTRAFALKTLQAVIAAAAASQIEAQPAAEDEIPF